MTIAMICSLVPLAYASYSPDLGSGYTITSNYHSVVSPIGSEVVVTAMTTDDAINKVQFVWKNPAGQVIWDETVAIFKNGTTYDANGVLKVISYAESKHIPGGIGDWVVEATFVNPKDQGWPYRTEIVSQRIVNHVPEIPILGTAGASVLMLLGFMYTMKRKSRKDVAS